MTNFTRCDREMARKIHAYRMKLQNAGIEEEEIYFAQLMKFDATAHENTWGIFWQWLPRSPDKGDLALWGKLYHQKKRIFNKSNTNPDEECIAVPIPYQKETKRGQMRRGFVWIDKLAHGAQALAMAAWSKKPRDGWNDKIERLQEIGRDQVLLRKHQTKFKDIERRARKGGAGII